MYPSTSWMGHSPHSASVLPGASMQGSNSGQEQKADSLSLACGHQHLSLCCSLGWPDTSRTNLLQSNVTAAYRTPLGNTHQLPPTLFWSCFFFCLQFEVCRQMFVCPYIHRTSHSETLKNNPLSFITIGTSLRHLWCNYHLWHLEAI